MGMHRLSSASERDVILRQAVVLKLDTETKTIDWHDRKINISTLFEERMIQLKTQCSNIPLNGKL
jgi:hypothetical protein